jgi:hypothetical protein
MVKLIKNADCKAIKRKAYVFTCPKIINKSCEIVSITILLDPDLLDCFGMKCPFCGEHMINTGESRKFLICYLCEEDNGGVCFLHDNEKKRKELGGPSCCPYGLNVYADFTGLPEDYIIPEVSTGRE